ncbi:sm-like protein LSM7 isoform X3 [Hordeum vulgare subsp. vulgare]|uniref:sm-like protein LSM7 isoform X3 n=1 Tax=Hordeum vulgare subsp. vulgare TaxID=112509 RepID=UPI001D1A4FD9|nr:sm-like protein LSM7 isoform X3 [Hordeum vulgare subsp. vulgare]
MSGRKETVLDLAKFVDKGVQVKLTGGRQVYPNATRADSGICTPPVTGTLKGYDQLLNLVLDEAIEFERGLQGHSGDACIANRGNRGDQKPLPRG